ncbi:unnamed protein product, partial [Mesorhabditis belari]|uniref:Uncharacterized protein n=1 Tax=Mesorhabditis belari TaxID=2138241 RepID=A0AAF3EDR6_9BILA
MSRKSPTVQRVEKKIADHKSLLKSINNGLAKIRWAFQTPDWESNKEKVTLEAVLKKGKCDKYIQSWLDHHDTFILRSDGPTPPIDSDKRPPLLFTSWNRFFEKNQQIEWLEQRASSKFKAESPESEDATCSEPNVTIEETSAPVDTGSSGSDGKSISGYSVNLDACEPHWTTGIVLLLDDYDTRKPTVRMKYFDRRIGSIVARILPKDSVVTAPGERFRWGYRHNEFIAISACPEKDHSTSYSHHVTRKSVQVTVLGICRYSKGNPEDFARSSQEQLDVWTDEFGLLSVPLRLIKRREFEMIPGKALKECKLTLEIRYQNWKSPDIIILKDEDIFTIKDLMRFDDLTLPRMEVRDGKKLYRFKSRTFPSICLWGALPECQEGLDAIECADKQENHFGERESDFHGVFYPSSSRKAYYYALVAGTEKWVDEQSDGRIYDIPSSTRLTVSRRIAFK